LKLDELTRFFHFLNGFLKRKENELKMFEELLKTKLPKLSTYPF